jgi:hypothetical protein
MEDAPNIWLIDTHAEGDRRHDAGKLVPQESVLNRCPRLVVQSGVVSARRDTLLPQPLSEALGVSLAECVDDGGCGWRLEHQCE